MKKLFILMALGSVGVASADQNYQPSGRGSCPSCNNRGGYYEDLSNNEGYYQQQANQNQNGYNQKTASDQ